MELVSHLSDRLLFAIPKKGRLHTQCLDLLKGADIQFNRNNRLDIALVKNLPVAIIFLPASDIPRFVGMGNVDLAITGQDVVAEAEMGGKVQELMGLGFGKCKLQIQVPEAGPIQSVQDLVGKRIVTSFEVLAKEYFDKVDTEYGGQVDGICSAKRTRIDYLGGSVEAACALGLADGIVDLVESGETMKAAGLHAIATLLTSEAALIRSTHAPESREPLIQLITNRIKGVIAANHYVLCQYNIRREALPVAVKITPGRRAATVSPLDDGQYVAVSSMVGKDILASTMDQLEAVGAEDILVIPIQNCRV